MSATHSQRLGSSMMELIVALAILGSAVAGIGRFVSTTHEGLGNQELSQRIGWELLAARERIASWKVAEITPNNIENLPFSLALTQQLSSPRWRARVVRISDPARALRVTLELHCELYGQSAQPDALTFWIDASSEVALERNDE